MSSRTIFIAGAGELGSRYLQGLAKCRIPLSIQVYDVNPQSLVRAQQRWLEVINNDIHHEINLISSLEQMPTNLDIAIVATRADVRPSVVREIQSISIVSNWILEKVLAQSEAALDEIVSQISTRKKAWVNTPRRILPWHQQIKSCLKGGGPKKLKLIGGSWGLACNSVHFLDMFAWMTNETLIHVGTECLDSQWIRAKRDGNWEILGTLTATFSGGSTATLCATIGEPVQTYEIDSGEQVLYVDEDAGRATRSDGLEIPGRVPLLSEVISDLVETILSTGNCELPRLSESVDIHRIFIRSLVSHWRQTVDANATAVPIT